jgi:tripartite-type tricarboxylate transporter receptor subunit TctC
VPFAAGGSTDVVARVVADGLTQELKQPFVVENRPGAGGALGTDLVAKAKPDGYTLGIVGTGSITIIPFVDPKLSYNPSRDLATIAILCTVDLLIVARSDSPHSTMNDLVAFARSKPGELTYSTAGVGTPTHLEMENFWKLADVKALHVAYSGDAPALNAVLAGDVNIGLVSASAASSLVQAGKLKAIAFGGPGRSAVFPNVLSIAEQTELKDYTATTWNAFMAPAETPRPIVEKINAAVNKIFGRAEVKQKFADLGLTVFIGDTKAATDFVNRDAEKRKRVIEQVGLKRE